MADPEAPPDQTTVLRPGRGVPTAAPATPGPAEDARYRELDELGRGGCGRVTRDWDRQLRRVVAHKRVDSGDEALKRILVQEARLLAYLDHPGVVQVFDGGDDDYTMRLLEGDTLKERMARGRLPIGEAVRIVSRVAEALANAHAKGVVHLDIKPANIMLQPYGQVSVIDWGMAQFHDVQAYEAFLGEVGETVAPEEHDPRVTSGGGTPSYMPVEQAAGEVLTPAADVFACGTVLYEMVAGSLPFPKGGGPRGVMRKAFVRPEPLSAHRADVPARLDDLCLRMLAPKPEDRPASFDQVLVELQSLSGAEVEGEVIELSPGDVLCREGEAGDTAYQLLSGSLAITIEGPEGPIEIAERGVGELIGEMAIVSRAPRSATVTAVVPTRVAVVTAARIERALDRANPLVARMVRSLSDRLREETERARVRDTS